MSEHKKKKAAKKKNKGRKADAFGSVSDTANQLKRNRNKKQARLDEIMGR